MASFVIEGGHKLHGEIHPQGAKNEVLQILCATLLTSEEVTVAGVWTLTLSVFRNWEPVLIMMRNEVFSVFAQSIWKVLICCWMKLRLPVRLIL